MLALAHSGLCNTFLNTERYAEALQHFNDSYAIDKATGNKLNEGYDQRNRSMAFWWLARFDDAHTLLSQALDIAEQGHNKDLQASIKLTEAQISLSRRRFPEAIAKSQQALDLAGAQNKDVAVEGKHLIGLSQALSGQAREGQAVCLEASETAATVNDPLQLSKSQLTLPQASLASGDTQRALESSLQARAFFAT